MCNLLVGRRRGDGVGHLERLERRRRAVGDAVTCPAFFVRAGRAGKRAARAGPGLPGLGFMSLELQLGVLGGV